MNLITPSTVCRSIAVGLSCFGLLHFSAVHADVVSDLMKGVFSEGLMVDLREPTFQDGVLSTDQGGVIQGPDLRIQARKISYTRKEDGDNKIWTIRAEGDLLIEYKKNLFVGEYLEYDFITQTGIILDGRTMIGAWFVGGKTIHLMQDDTCLISDAYLTTSEGPTADWYLTAENATVQNQHYLSALNVKFKIYNVPLLWVPSLSTNLDTLSEHPFRYTFGWGGVQGPRLGASYEAVSWEQFRLLVMADYRLKRGPGGGFETHYHSLDRKSLFETINYVARDISLFNRHENMRYRFQGYYKDLLWGDKLSFELSYDKLSDEDMAADYADQSLALVPSERTQLEIRRQEESWIANLFARVRVNNFETILQELPSFYATSKPFYLPQTGIISDLRCTASYLDFTYAKDISNVHDYNAPRLQLLQKLYKPIVQGAVTIQPEVGGTAIFYGNSPGGSERWVALGTAGATITAPLHRYYSERWKHIITPYAEYQYFTFPTVSPDDHYIFDLNDAWYRVSMVRFGIDQSLYLKQRDGIIRRYLYADLYSRAFFETETIPTTIYKSYARLVMAPFATIRQTLETAWDWDEQELDHLNFRTEWTVNEDFAISAEYRHRDDFCWRKADPDNFVMESFHTIEELRHSQVSFRRDAAVLHFFYRFHPNWAIEFESLHGWNRRDHSRYIEFEVDLYGTLRSACRVKMSYQHREGDNRVAVYLSLGGHSPDHERTGDFIPSLSF